MGKMKDYVIDMMNSSEEKRIADLLGISFEEVSSLEYQIETDESDDGLIYNYRIEFDQNSPEDILNKIKRLQNGYSVYVEPWELYDNYDYDEQYEAIIDNKHFVEKFFVEIGKLTKLSKLKVEDKDLEKILMRQIFISVIGTMETFLSETFINLTNDNDTYFRNFIESHPEFKKRKFELREIFNENENLKETAKVVMLETIYHNLPTVKEMFADTFKIKFPKINIVYPLILKRHDLVHRNGKTKENIEVETNDKAIEELINNVCEFVTQIAGVLGLER